MAEARPLPLEELHCALRDPDLRWMFAMPDLFLPTSLFHPHTGIQIVLHFSALEPPLRRVSEQKFLTRPIFSVPQTSATRISLFQLPPAHSAYPTKMPLRIFLTKTGEVLTEMSQRSFNYRSKRKKDAGHKKFSRTMRGLERFADNGR